MLLSGEPGIGKSRLTAALLERLAAEPQTRLRYFCSPQRADSALYPIIGQIERAAGLRATTSPQTNSINSMQCWRRVTSAQDATLFAEMLSLPNDGRHPRRLELTPHSDRQRTLEALVLQVTVLSRQNPVLMIFEDTHWTPPRASNCLVVSWRIIRLRVLLIVTFGPEFEPPWIGRPY